MFMKNNWFISGTTPRPTTTTPTPTTTTPETSICRRISGGHALQQLSSGIMKCGGPNCASCLTATCATEKVSKTLTVEIFRNLLSENYTFLPRQHGSHVSSQQPWELTQTCYLKKSYQKDCFCPQILRSYNPPIFQMLYNFESHRKYFF